MLFSVGTSLLDYNNMFFFLFSYFLNYYQRIKLKHHIRFKSSKFSINIVKHHTTQKFQHIYDEISIKIMSFCIQIIISLIKKWHIEPTLINSIQFHIKVKLTDNTNVNQHRVSENDYQHSSIKSGFCCSIFKLKYWIKYSQSKNTM